MNQRHELTQQIKAMPTQIEDRRYVGRRLRRELKLKQKECRQLEALVKDLEQEHDQQEDAIAHITKSLDQEKDNLGRSREEKFVRE